MTAKKGKSKGFADLTKKVLPENRPTSLAEFQNGDSVKTSKRQNVKETNHTTSKDFNAKELDQRFTLYLTEDNLNAVEDAWAQLRKAAPKGCRKRITKSLIIDEAIGIVMKEFESEKEDSRLAVKVLKRFNT